MVTVETINDLRALGLGFNQGDKVYVKCHTLFWDGGGGFFTFVPASLLEYDNGLQFRDDDNGIIIISELQDYYWVRDVQGEVNIRFYGDSEVDANGFSNDDGSKIQRAIDYAALSAKLPLLTRGTIVFFPAREYNITKNLILRKGVSLRGESMETTKFKAIYTYDAEATSETNNGGHMLTIEKGPIIGCNISDIHFLGNIVPDKDKWDSTPNTITKGCIYFEAIASTSGNNDGGVWYSTFKNIRINYFNGDGIFFKGGIDNYKLPHQCNTFENVVVNRQKDYVPALTLMGEIGQFTFINCGFSGYLWAEGTKALKGQNCLIGNSVNSMIGLSTSVATFLNCTFQDTERGIDIKYSDSLTIDNCWFENLDISVVVSGFDKGRPSMVNILNSRFANAASFGSLKIIGEHVNNPPIDYEGSCIISSGSYINVHNNHVTASNLANEESDGSPNRAFNKLFILAIDGNKGVRATGNTFAHPLLGLTSGITQNIIGNSSMTSLEVYNNTTIVLSFSSVPNISSINSTCLAGERIVFKVKSGNSNVTFSNAGNIKLGNSVSPLTVAAGRTVEFVKTDSNIEGLFYQLTSIY